MKPIRKREAVLEDLARYYAWIAKDNEDAAERLLAAVDFTFEQISKTPGIGWERPWKHPKLTGLRSWRVEGFPNYLVFYREEPNAIEVYAVLHGAQHLIRALRDR